MQFIDIENDNPGYDNGLWLHVASSFKSQEWDRVASGTAIYVENHFRKAMGDPKSSDGRSINAGPLVQLMFSDEYFPLGTDRGAQQGWRNLAAGFVASVRNTDSHRIQERIDLQQYAMGVLGLGSLLLTQLKHEYPGLFKKHPPIGYAPNREELRMWPPHSRRWQSIYYEQSESLRDQQGSIKRKDINSNT